MKLEADASKHPTRPAETNPPTPHHGKTAGYQRRDSAFAVKSEVWPEFWGAESSRPDRRARRLAHSGCGDAAGDADGRVEADGLSDRQLQTEVSRG